MVKQYWVINISNSDVFLDDLGILIPAGQHINLLSGRYDITIDDVKYSEENGSIKNKSNRIKINHAKPNFGKKVVMEEYKKPIPRRRFVVKEKINEQEPDLLFDEAVERHAEKIAEMMAADEEKK
jgi:hypothetical protein